MSELISLVNTVISNPSPAILITIGFIAMIYKSRVLLQFFLDIKDLNKKRLMQKFEENHQLQEKNYLSRAFKDDYSRLCEEQQLQAIVGCQYCSKEMAQYILTRKNISRALRLYHRIDNDIEVKDGRIVPIKQMESWRIKLNSYAGLVFYIGLTLFGASPFILIGIAKLFRQKLELSMSFYMDATFMFIAFFILGGFLFVSKS